MKKLAVVLAVAASLATAHAADAANLQAGWYAKIGNVGLSGFDPNSGRDFARGWSATSPLGKFGPFDVTHPTEPDPLFPQRVIAVPSTVSGVAAGTAVYEYGVLDAPLPAPATYMSVAYETSYDAAQMMLQLCVQHSNGQSELVWGESRSGHHIGNVGVLWPGQSILPTDTLYFSVVVVPEPSQCAMLALYMLGLLCVRRRMAR